MTEEGGEDDGEQHLAVVADQTHHVVIAPVVQGSFSHLGGRREEGRESRRERGKEGAEREREGGGERIKMKKRRERGEGEAGRGKCGSQVWWPHWQYQCDMMWCGVCVCQILSSN